MFFPFPTWFFLFCNTNDNIDNNMDDDNINDANGAANVNTEDDVKHNVCALERPWPDLSGTLLHLMV